MEKKNKTRSKKKLALIYLAVGAGIALQFLFLAWLIISGLWWALGVYALVGVFGIVITLLVLKDFEFICPNCDAVFKPSLPRTFFTTGDNRVRWMTCPECRHTDWCVMRNQKTANKK